MDLFIDPCVSRQHVRESDRRVHHADAGFVHGFQDPGLLQAVLKERIDPLEHVLLPLQPDGLNLLLRDPFEVRTELDEHRVVAVNLGLQASEVRDHRSSELLLDLPDAGRHVDDIWVLHGPAPKQHAGTAKPMGSVPAAWARNVSRWCWTTG